jgi:hypothetical protein
MLKIAELNSETSNNSIRLAAAALAISVARLAAAALAIPVTAAPPKPIAAIPRRGACRVVGGRAASGASWFNCIKGVLGELVNLMAKKF